MALLINTFLYRFILFAALVGAQGGVANFDVMMSSRLGVLEVSALTVTEQSVGISLFSDNFPYDYDFFRARKQRSGSWRVTLDPQEKFPVSLAALLRPLRVGGTPVSQQFMTPEGESVRFDVTDSGAYVSLESDGIVYFAFLPGWRPVPGTLDNNG